MIGMSGIQSSADLDTSFLGRIELEVVLETQRSSCWSEIVLPDFAFRVATFEVGSFVAFLIL